MAELPGELADAIAGLARTPRLLVALDFDGTLAPTVDDPDDARVLPAARDAIIRLVAIPSTRVAVVSGRALASLERVSELPFDVLLVGSHGAEFRFDGQEWGPDLNPAERERLDTLYAVLAEVARHFDGVRLEVKPAGVAVHTRLLSRDVAARVEAKALDGALIHPVTSRRGKDVLEFSVRPANKGAALDRLREYAAASGILFAGDDVTDEDAFASLIAGDIGVKVGTGETAAGYRVDSPSAIAPMLVLLAETRARAEFPLR